MINQTNRPSNTMTSPPASLKIALVGCGAIAESYYLPALAKYPSIMKKLILVDRNRSRAQELAAKFNATRCLDDYIDVLNEGVDGVIIATPSHLHYKMSMDSLRSGVHVLCEKPLAETLEEASQMVTQAEGAGVILMANYMRRLYASNQKVKEILAEGTLGEPLSIQYSEGEKFRWPTASGFYFNTKISNRGVLLDRGAHILDLVCWWLGAKPYLISSQNDSFGGREAVARVKFGYRQCQGEVKLSLLGKIPCVFSVECERGAIEGDVFEFRSVVIVTDSGRRKRLKLTPRETYHQDFGHTMVRNFLDAISGLDAPLVLGQDVLHSVDLIDECYSAATRFEMPWYEIPEILNED